MFLHDIPRLRLKRLDGVTRSGVLSVVAATLHGLSPIRAFGCGGLQTRALVRTLTANARSLFFWRLTGQYMNLVLNSAMTLFNAIFVFGILVVRPFYTINPSLLAVSLVYSLQLVIYVAALLNNTIQAEQFLTSVERLLSFCRLEPETTLDDEDDDIEERNGMAAVGDVETGLHVAESQRWPSDGKIDVVELKYRYRIDAPLVLKGVTVSFPPRKKTGLCGRTGSGKSSIIAAMARLHDVCGGRIVIDGVDVSTIPLSHLRSAMAVIPQQPALFAGTVRFNVDPLGQRSDAEILAALKEAHLRTKQRDILDAHVDHGGHNWSTGEAQLLCLARALVLKRRICFFDEVTANVDMDTDSQIQATLTDCQSATTLIVIAHRIPTILAADHIVVLRDGIVLESGPPTNLLRTPGSAFSTMVNASSSSSASTAA